MIEEKIRYELIMLGIYLIASSVLLAIFLVGVNWTSSIFHLIWRLATLIFFVLGFILVLKHWGWL